MSWKRIQDAAFLFYICVFAFNWKGSCYNNEDRLIMFEVFMLTLFVCLEQCSGYPRSPFPVCGEYYQLFVLSAKHRAPWLFMWSQSGCHEYLKRLWLSVSAWLLLLLSPGQERGDQAEVRRQDVPRICKSEGGEGMKCWMSGVRETWWVELSQFVIFSCTFSYFQCAGQTDHLDVFCTHTGGMQAPLEVWSGEPSFL